MSSKNKWKVKSTHGNSPRLEIPHYPGSQAYVLWEHTTETREESSPSPQMAALPASPTSSDSLSGFPSCSHPGPLPSVMGEQDLRALLQALPTQADMEALVSQMEEACRRDLHTVKADVQQLSSSCWIATPQVKRPWRTACPSWRRSSPQDHHAAATHGRT